MSVEAPPRIPIESGFFTIPDTPGEPPRLLACRCRSCGEHLFPRRQVCARCLAPDLEETRIGPRGRLHTDT